MTKGRPRLPVDGVDPRVLRDREQARRYQAARYTRDAKFSWAEAALRDARKRAAKHEREFDLTLQDILDLCRNATHCPMTGMELCFARGRGYHSDSPTIDRIDNTAGYTRQNVHIVSRDANTAKSRLTIEQLVRLGDWARERQAEVLRQGEDRLATLMANFFDVVEKFESRGKAEF